MSSPDNPRPLLPPPGRTWVMGILNLTPDSFSDGGRLQRPGAALREAGRMLAAGAQLLDLGGQSTRPGAAEVGDHAELARVLPTLRQIRQAHPAAVLSVDTYRAAVAEAALAAGADWINDVSGGRREPAILPLVAAAGCPYVLMHSRGDSRTMDSQAVYGDVVAEVRSELLRASERALAAGVRPQQLVWDPGLGFAKTTEQNLELLRSLELLADEGFPLLVGPSRKRFIGAVLAEERPRARIWGTAAVCALATARGAAVLRVHDVGPIVQTARMAEAVRAGAGPGFSPP
jgi:dihydropteroate synthase